MIEALAAVDGRIFISRCEKAGTVCAGCALIGTPLATARFTAHEHGGFYGLETSPRRVLSEALSPRTPVPGLFLSGQDVMTPGIAGALVGGVLCAAAIEPRVFTKMKGGVR